MTKLPHPKKLFSLVRTRKYVRHRRARPHQVSIVFYPALLLRQREWLFKKRRTRRERRYAGHSLHFFPSFPHKSRYSSLSAGVTGRFGRWQSCVPYGVTLSLRFVSVSLSFGSVRSSFSLTYLRHSVSARADYCPDVVSLLCTTPVNAATFHQLG